MKPKLNLIAVLVAMGLVIAMTACGSNDGAAPSTIEEALDQQQELQSEEQPDAEPESIPDGPPILMVDWIVAVSGVDGVTDYTCDQAAGVTPMLITATVDGNQGQFGGVSLYFMLENMGAEGFSSVTLEGGEGSVTLDSAEVAMEEVAVVWANYGEPIDEDGPVWVLLGGDRAPVKGLTRITVS